MSLCCPLCPCREWHRLSSVSLSRIPPREEVTSDDAEVPREQAIHGRRL